MADRAEAKIRVWVAEGANGERYTDTREIGYSYAAGARQQQTVTIAASTFTALTVPSGATGVCIVLPTTGSATISLKGITGDSTSILVDGTNGVPIILPLRGTPVLGFAKSDAGTIDIRIWWF